MPLSLDLGYKSTLDKLMGAKNIAESMDEAARGKLGQWCQQAYLSDKSSRSQWEQRMAAAMKMALQVMEGKTYPWPNASNVKFPLLTVAALNFHARAYPSLVPPTGLVKCNPVGYNAPQDLIDRCARVGAHMSYQIQHRTNWEPETDKALLVISLMGCGFKKVYYDATRRQRCSDFVLPQNLVVHYQTSSLETAPRYGEFFQYTHNEVREEELSGTWLEAKSDTGGMASAPIVPTDALRAVAQQAQGLSPVNSDTTSNLYSFVEFSCWLDLDGDGYEEPYIVTFDLATSYVRRVVARFLPSGVSKDKKDRVLRITPLQMFVKLPFIPSPDGGFYDLGLGALLGPINASVDSAINSLFDAAHMKNMGGGFLGRGARIKRGATTFVPGEWKQVDSAGSDLSNNVVPLPVGEPSKVLFDLTVYLVNYAERIASANEVQSGEVPDWNMKAEVMRIADANGARIFAAIFKRLWRAFSEEFNLFYLLNRNYPIELDYKQDGRWFQVSQADYMGTQYEVCPTADPNAVTDSQKRAQAEMIYATANQVPGHNMAAVVKRRYAAYGVPDIKEIFPVDEVPEPPNIELLKLQVKGQEVALKEAQVQASIMEGQAKLQMAAEKLSAEILNLYAQAAEHAANAEAEGTYAAVALLNAQIANLKHQRDGVLGMLDILKDHLFPNNKETDSGKSSSGGLAPGGSGAGASLPGMVVGAPGAQVPLLPSTQVAGNAD